MKRLLSELIPILLLVLLMGCSASAGDKTDEGGSDVGENGSDVGDNGSEDSGCIDDTDKVSKGDNSDTPTEDYVLKATVRSVSDVLEVEVTESDYAFGIYRVLLSDSTVYESKTGASIKLSDISVGDTVEITYGGQVMMSYPPQIVGKRIRLV